MASWILNDTPSKTFPLYSRANVGEVFPDPISPLNATTGFLANLEPGWRSAYVECQVWDHEIYDAAVKRILEEGLDCDFRKCGRFVGALSPAHHDRLMKEFEARARHLGEEVEFAVSDNGPGLGAEELEHVFDRFWRAESGETQSVGGTGLGLAIAKSLVELHGGAISANSEPGEGATFRFVLPIAKDGRPSRKQSGSGTKAGAAG